MCSIPRASEEADYKKNTKNQLLGSSSFLTRHAERSEVWKGILVSVVFSLSGYRYFGDSGTDQREILHDGIYVSRVCLFLF